MNGCSFERSCSNWWRCCNETSRFIVVDPGAHQWLCGCWRVQQWSRMVPVAGFHRAYHFVCHHIPPLPTPRLTTFARLIQSSKTSRFLLRKVLIPSLRPSAILCVTLRCFCSGQDEFQGGAGSIAERRRESQRGAEGDGAHGTLRNILVVGVICVDVSESY